MHPRPSDRKSGDASFYGRNGGSVFPPADEAYFHAEGFSIRLGETGERTNDRRDLAELKRSRMLRMEDLPLRSDRYVEVLSMQVLLPYIRFGFFDCSVGGIFFSVSRCEHKGQLIINLCV